MHLAGSRLFLLKEVIHSCLYINAEFRGGQSFGAELVVFPFGTLLLEAVITAEALGPYGVVVQNADLMLLPAAIQAHDERFLL